MNVFASIGGSFLVRFEISIDDRSLIANGGRPKARVENYHCHMEKKIIIGSCSEIPQHFLETADSALSGSASESGCTIFDESRFDFLENADCLLMMITHRILSNIV